MKHFLFRKQVLNWEYLLSIPSLLVRLPVTVADEIGTGCTRDFVGQLFPKQSAEFPDGIIKKHFHELFSHEQLASTRSLNKDCAFIKVF